MFAFILYTVVGLFALFAVFALGFVYGTDKEREAARKRMDLARRYRGESGLAAHAVALGLLACATAYVAGSVWVWALQR